MKHPDEGLIHAWLDHALDVDEGREIEQHVTGCGECAAAVAEARGLIAAASRIVRQLDGVPANVLPESTLLERARVRATNGRTSARQPRAWWRSSGLAAAALLLVSTTSWFAWRDRRSGDEGSRSATTAMAESAAASAPIAVEARVATGVADSARGTGAARSPVAGLTMPAPMMSTPNDSAGVAIAAAVVGSAAGATGMAVASKASAANAANAPNAGGTPSSVAPDPMRGAPMRAEAMRAEAMRAEAMRAEAMRAEATPRSAMAERSREQSRSLSGCYLLTSSSAVAFASPIGSPPRPAMAAASADRATRLASAVPASAAAPSAAPAPPATMPMLRLTDSVYLLDVAASANSLAAAKAEGRREADFERAANRFLGYATGLVGPARTAGNAPAASSAMAVIWSVLTPGVVRVEGRDGAVYRVRFASDSTAVSQRDSTSIASFIAQRVRCPE